MRSLLFPLVASTALILAAPLGSAALAQNGSDQNAGNNHAQTAKVQQQLRQSLEKSGYKNIQIQPEAFLVHAQTPTGAHMVMMISPDEVTEAVTGSGSTMPPPSQPHPGQLDNQGNPNAGPNGQSGTSR